MRYDPTLAALLKPGLGPLLDAGLFAGKPDALCAELARLVYFDFVARRADLDTALAAHGLTRAELISGKRFPAQTEVLIATAADGTAYVVFRGTQSLRDFLSDIAAWRTGWSGRQRVHWGFAQAYRVVKSQLDEWCRDNPAMRLVATGHSLGGALATLFASDHPRAELVTFGSPLVGNAAFAASFAERQVRRYRDCADLVARVPYGWLGFCHVAPPNYFDRHGTPQPETAIAADMAAARAEYRQRYRHIKRKVPLRDGADHAPINYVSALLGLREA